MKQVFAKKGGVELENVEEPEYKDNYVKVKVQFSAISIGTELKTYKKFTQPIYKTALENKDLIKKVIMNKLTSKKTNIPKKWPLGYSCVGKVIESKSKDFKEGNTVACAGQGYANHAEIIVVPKNLVAKVPEGVDLEEAAHTTLGAIAIQSVRRLDPKFGETVVVYGLGLLGNIITQILQASGCKVIGIGRNQKRSSMAKTHITFTKDVVNSVLEETNNIGTDGIIIAATSKDKKIINNAMEMCRKKAKVVLVGDVPIHIERSSMFRKELDFLISTSYGPGRYDEEYEEKGVDYPLPYVRWTENRNMQEFLRLLKEKKISIKPLIGKTYPITKAKEAYIFLNTTREKPLSVIFEF
tara:strand:- start:931 stop:1995 length:1065 start_codon:yes stop_codon:yes gene_type:complete